MLSRQMAFVMAKMLSVRISGAKAIKGEINLPGDKSISHRAAILAAIAKGETRISNFATGADCSATLDCLNALGVGFKREAETVTIAGSGKYGLTEPRSDLDCGNSGTTMRLLAGVLSGQGFTSTLVGDSSLEGRPMKRVIDPLTEMGSRISSNEGRAPLTIYGSASLTAIKYQPPVASAQIKSCVLLAGLYATGETSVFETTPTRDHTERMLRYLGAEIAVEKNGAGSRATVSGKSELSARDIEVARDVSTAAFFMVAAACLEGSDITLPNIGVNPTRRAVVDCLVSLGADVVLADEREISNEPVATIRVRGGLSHAGNGLLISGKMVADLIDEIPVLAVLGTRLEGGLEVRGARELRLKESDRIAAIVENLRRMNARIDEFDDGFHVFPSRLNAAKIETYGDHRIAMAFSVAALLAKNETEIKGAECAGVSFPGFFKTLESVVT